MANFARMGDNNVVLDVVHVNNVDIVNAFQVENEETGLAYLKNILPNARFIKTSKSGRSESRPADVGDIYDPVKKRFIPPPPYPSWAEWDEDSLSWLPPIPMPEKVWEPHHRPWVWDEETVSWVLFGPEEITETTDFIDLSGETYE